MIKNILYLALIANFGKLLAETWVGATPELTVNTNWNPATVPVSGGTGIFDATGGSKFPVLNAGINLTTGNFDFTDSTAYTFTIGAARTLILNTTGITGVGASNQTFNLTAPSGLIRFDNSASAASATFNASSGPDIQFNNTSNAGTGVFNISGTGSNLLFSLSSSAANAQINISNGGSTNFNNTSTASSAIINATGIGSTVTFTSSATAANAQLTLSNGASLLFNNTSSGGASAVSLAGGASLRINQNNTLGSLESDASATGNLFGFNLQIGSNNTNRTFAGALTGFGGSSLTKVGTGTQILSGINTYLGPTTVNAGQLTITGAVAGNFIVNVGATSNGNGTVGGSYTQNAGSFFLVDQPDYLNVIGAVTINGGEVLVADAIYPANTPFIILHSDVSRTGVYDGVSALNPNSYFIPQLSYDAQNVYLTLITQFQAFGLTPNEIAVAAALDFASDPTLISALTSLGVPDFLNALNQLSGVQYANLIQLTELSNQRFLKQIFDPMRENILQPSNVQCGKWISWGNIEGGQGFLSRDYNAEGFRMFEANVALGAYRFFHPNFVLGIAENYEYGEVDFYQGGKGKSNNWQGALYTLAFNPLGYLFAEVAGGYHSWRIARDLNFDGFIQTAVGKPRISHVAAYGELGFNGWIHQFLIQPFLALEYGHYWRRRVDERGAEAANLTVTAQNFDDLESRLGAHVSTDFGYILISADASWRYRYSQLGDHLNLHFSEFGPEFTILGPSQSRSSFEGALYAQRLLNPTLLLYVQGDGLINNRFASYSISVGAQKIW